MLAVEDVSFSLGPGDVFGFIGSNGAGKTTTIKMIATLLEPTGGTARLDGHDIVDSPVEVRRRLGYMPDFFGVYDDVLVWEYLDFFANLYDVPKTERPGIIDQVLELTDLTVKKDSYVQSLSRGMQQRLCLSRCLVHDPMLLLLDEPASGLDPRARADLKDLMVELGRMGKIIIVSSHILPELAGFCNKVGIIERGRMLAMGNVADIVRSIRPVRSLVIKVLDSAEAAADSARSHGAVQGVAVLDEKSLKVEFNGDFDEQSVLLKTLLQNNVRVLEFHEDSADLEDVFLTLTTGAVN